MGAAMRSNASRYQSFNRGLSVYASQVPADDVVTIPAGAQGVLVNFNLKYHPIANAAGTDIGGVADTSISVIAGVVFTTMVGYKEDADLANGEYYVDHLTGRCRGRKDTNGVAQTFRYNIFVQPITVSVSSLPIKDGVAATLATVLAGGVLPNPATSNALVVTVRDGITVDSEFPAAAAITDNFATPTTTSVMAMGMVYDGAAWDMLRGDAANGMLVNLGSNNDVTVSTLPAGNLGMQLMAASLSVVPASNITDATYIGDIKFGEALPAGDSNIGNVDIATFPAGNLGMQLMAASLSVTPASNITDATYIGDIKFGESLPAGTNTIGAVSLAPRTSGGTTPYKNLDVDESGDNAVASACQMYGYYVYNNNAATLYLKIYDKATAPTVGTDVPVLTIPIPTKAAANVAFPNGVQFTNGIGVGATTGVADNDTGAPGANDVIVNIFYKA